ncbi:hypothetical protein [Sphingomonas morindae]|uniref:Uncharacterized protein n=1 Tax=Sphingomonas morindae TaxID=1541170 RepID=A0ABY4X4E4_9SPHN|nr:hypothetical protein [Sphingomonas morindae]USI71767.1 hypothetical protein LHA26_10580 [Sphingomonas morindae]
MLAALIAAVREADDGAGLIATLPVAGHALLERQVRLAVAAGAGHVVLLVERVPAALTSAIDRLRRDGITVDVARSAGDGADRFHPDERVLIFADGALAPAGQVARLAASAAPALLTIGEARPDGAFERIDSGARWSGLALVSGDLLRRTVAMLGDWDLHSTLLRRAVGASARRLDSADGADLGPAGPVLLVRSRAGARAATEASLMRDLSGEAWPMRRLYGPLARLLVGLVLDRPLDARWLRRGAVAAALLAIPCAWWGLLLLGLLLLVGGALLEALGRLVASIRLSAAGPGDGAARLRGLAMAAALAAFAAHRMDAGWIAPLLAAITIGASAATARETGLLGRLAGLPPPGWIADADALVLLFGAAAIAQATLAGLALLAFYAALSFASVQHLLAARAGTASETGGKPL